MKYEEQPRADQGSAPSVQTEAVPIENETDMVKENSSSVKGTSAVNAEAENHSEGKTEKAGQAGTANISAREQAATETGSGSMPAAKASAQAEEGDETGASSRSDMNDQGKSEAEGTVDAKAKSRGKVSAKGKAKSKTGSKAKGKSKAGAKGKAGSKTGAKSTADTKADAKGKADTKADAEGKADTKADVKAGTAEKGKKVNSKNNKNTKAKSKVKKGKGSKKSPKSKRERSTTYDLLTFLEEAARELQLSQEAILAFASQPAFLDFFKGVTDYRCASRVQYPLECLLLMVLFAILSMRRCSFNGIATYIKVNSDIFVKLGLLKDNGKVPSHDTIRLIFMNLNPEDLNCVVIMEKLLVFFNFLAEAMKNEDFRRYMIASGDGKYMNGTDRGKDTKHARKALNMMNIYLAGFHLCLMSIPVLKKNPGNVEGEKEMDPEDRKKTNEIPVLQSVLDGAKSLFDKSMIFTADALHCQRETVNLLVNTLKIHYLLNVKKNQKTLFKTITDTIDGNMKDVLTIEKDGQLFQLFRVTAWMDTCGFAGVKYYVRVYSYKHKRNEKSVRIYISSLSNPEAVIDAIQSRWKIEDDLHRTKDVVFNEDRFTCTDDNACSCMCTMVNIAYSVLCLFRAIGQFPTQDYAVQVINRDPYKALNVVATVLESSELKNQLKDQIGVIARRRMTA